MAAGAVTQVQEKTVYGCNACVCFLFVINFILGLIVGGGASNRFEVDVVGKWMDVTRKETFHFLCEREPQRCEVNAGFKMYGKFCFSLNTYETKFDDAVQKCKDEDATLAVIESAQENTQASKACAKSNKHMVWIGLHQPNGGTLTTNWVWVDGSASSYRNWAKWSDGNAEPNQWDGKEEDAAAMATDAMQKDLNNAKEFFDLFRLIFLLVGILSLLLVCMFVGFSVAGVKKSNKCLLIAGISGEGACGGILCCLSLMGLLGTAARSSGESAADEGGEDGGQVVESIGNIFVALTMIAASAAGCWVCCSMDTGRQPVAQSGPVTIGQPVQGTVLK